MFIFVEKIRDMIISIIFGVVVVIAWVSYAFDKE
jgi:hypothetical protein